MKKNLQKIIGLVIALLITLSIGMIAWAASDGNSGTLNGASWSTSLNGSSSSITGTTSYGMSQRVRSVSVTGTYVGPSFTGYRSASGYDGNQTGTVSTTVRTPEYNDRFISGSGSHVIDSITDSTSIHIN